MCFVFMQLSKGAKREEVEQMCFNLKAAHLFTCLAQRNPASFIPSAAGLHRSRLWVNSFSPEFSIGLDWVGETGSVHL